MQIRHILAGGMFVALDKGFEYGSYALTDLVRELLVRNHMLISCGLLLCGAGVAALVCHAAHKVAERHERESCVIYDDWRDL